MDFKLKKRWYYTKNKALDTLLNNNELKNLDKFTLEILANRGIDTPNKIKKFLYSNISDLYDTRLMKDAEKAVDIIIKCLKNNSKMVIYGDYDMDGAGATYVAVKLLRNLGCNVDYHINDRFKEGYGMCTSGIDKIIAKYPNVELIITVDNGIVAYESIDYAKSKGINVIVTDHHDPSKNLPLPNADAVVNPKRNDDQYPFKGLCGAGIIFKIMLLLYWKMDKDLNEVYGTLDVVALSTIGDVVPIVDENRIIVKEGLKLAKKEKHIHFKLFREITEVSEVNSHFTFAFIYVPMINALGRLDGSPNIAIDMFLSEDEEFIRSSLTYMKEVNDKRKELTETQLNIAEKMLEEKGLKNVIVLYNETFHEGIIGLIAGRLKEKYNRPVLIFTKNNDFLKSSCRSIDGFHLKNCFDTMSELFLHYGGHEKAAGASIKMENLEELELRLNILSDKLLTPEDYIVKLNTDAVIDAQNVNLDIIDAIKILEPFGESFPKPVIGLKNFTSIKNPKYIGEEKNHIKLTGNNLSVIGWKVADIYKKMGEPKSIKALGFPECNVYKNNVSLQYIIKDDNIRGCK